MPAEEDHLVFWPYNSHYKIGIKDKEVTDKVYKWLVKKQIHMVDPAAIYGVSPESVIAFSGTNYRNKEFKIYKSNPDKHIEGTLSGEVMYDLYYMLTLDWLARYLTRPEWAKEGTPEHLEWQARFTHSNEGKPKRPLLSD
jgi:hypothetical protein